MAMAGRNVDLHGGTPQGGRDVKTQNLITTKPIRLDGSCKGRPGGIVTLSKNAHKSPLRFVVNLDKFGPELPSILPPKLLETFSTFDPSAIANDVRKLPEWRIRFRWLHAKWHSLCEPKALASGFFYRNVYETATLG